MLIETFDEARSAVLFGIAELPSSDRDYLMNHKFACFVIQLLMNYLPQDQRTKLAHLLLDIENEEHSQKLIKDTILDTNGSRSLEVLIRSASDETVNSIFISFFVIPVFFLYSCTSQLSLIRSLSIQRALVQIMLFKCSCPV